MKYRTNPLLDEMLGEDAVVKERCDAKIQLRSTQKELDMYRDLVNADIDMPFMIREFVVKLHDKVFPK